jgi:hypothetical protein
VRRAAVTRRRRARQRPAEPGRLDQFDPARDHFVGILRLDRLDISRIDHRQPQIGPAIPHRHRRRLDQPGQRLERRFEPHILLLQARDLALALGRIEKPQNHRGRSAAVHRRSLPFDDHRPPAALRANAHVEGTPGPLRRGDFARKRLDILGGQAFALAAQFGKKPHRRLDPEPGRNLPRQVEPAIAVHDHRLRRRCRIERGQPVERIARPLLRKSRPQSGEQRPARSDQQQREHAAGGGVLPKRRPAHPCLTGAIGTRVAIIPFLAAQRRPLEGT